MVRLAAPVTRMLLALLREELDPVPVYSLQPDLSVAVPVVMARKTPGGGAIDPRFYDRCMVDVQCWHTSDRDADDLAENVRVALVLAWRQQTVIGGLGSIASYDEISSPASIPDEFTPKGIYRYQATYQLGIRPA